jgi:hypothetical protein
MAVGTFKVAPGEKYYTAYLAGIIYK